MIQPNAISTLKDFMRFVENLDPAHAVFGLKLESGILIVSTSTHMPGYYPESPPVSLRPLKLPRPESAAQWWRDLWEGDVVDFRIANLPDYELPGHIVVIAKTAIWTSLPDLFLPLSKAVFQDITVEEFEARVGRPLAFEMIAEQSLLGISVRRQVAGQGGDNQGRSE